jgi:hypothetical protein
VFQDENTPSEYDRGWNEALEAARDAVCEVYRTGRLEDPVDNLLHRKIKALKRSAP